MRATVIAAALLALAAAPPARGQNAPPNAAQLREQIREQVRRDVEQATRQAQTEARQAQIEARNAQREAQIDARNAQRDAQEAVRDAQREGAFNVEVPPIPPIPPIIVRQGRGGFTTSTGDPFPFGDIPPRVESTAIAFFITLAAIFIGTPLARAFGRRIDRRGAVAGSAPSPEVVGRLERIEQAVDAVALEVERISEGQRYVTKLMADTRGLPAPDGAAANEARLAERAAGDRVAERAR